MDTFVKSVMILPHQELAMFGKMLKNKRKLQSILRKVSDVGQPRQKRMRFTVRRYDSVPIGGETPRSRSPASSVGASPGSLGDKSPSNSSDKLTGSSFGKPTPQSTLTSLEHLMNPVAKRGRIFASRYTARLVKKEGECNITNMNVSSKRSKYLIDLFTTLLDMKWRYCILLFFMAFIISWLVFGMIYLVICIVHEDHMHRDDPDWLPCHTNVYDFTTAFLFSLETQHTIGYGFRAMEPNCPPAIITLCAQSCIGVFFQCIVTGLVFAKLSRPKRRGQTIIFSEKAVICQRDGKLNLLFRVGDMRKSHFVATSIRAVMVKNRLTKEGEVIPLCIHPLALETESSGKAMDGFVFLMWPVVITHHINEDSPLWDTSAEQLLTERFEIVVILEGTVESSGMTTQVRTSYLPSEILWGERPAPLLTFQKATGGYRIDHKQFHATIPVPCPEYSAKQLARMSSDEPRTPTDPHADFPINLTAPPSHFTPRRSPSGSGPLRRLKNSLKKNRRHSELPQLQQIVSKSPECREVVHRGSVPHVSYRPGETDENTPPPSYKPAKTIHKCTSENGIVYDMGGSGDGRPTTDNDQLEQTSAVV